MKLRVIASGSKGNCYILTDSHGQSLILEAGVPLKQVMKALDFDVSGVVGFLVTHEHADHAGRRKEYEAAGLKDLTAAAEWQINQMAIGEKWKEWIIQSFPVVHDAETWGFFIHHDDCGPILFITDTNHVPFKFSTAEHFIIECNYDDDVMKGKIEAGTIHPSLADRIKWSHMSLQTLSHYLSVLKARLNTVVLIHLSDTNIDEYKAQGHIAGQLGCPVYVAEKGLEIELM